MNSGQPLVNDIADIIEVPSRYVNQVLEYAFKPRFKGGKSGEIAFDYLVDFDLIYACFKRYYDIDLIDDDLDWWKFTAILEDLINSETSLSNRMELRTREIPKRTKGDAKYISNLMAMKAKYRICGNIKEQATQKSLKGVFSFLKAKAKGG